PADDDDPFRRRSRGAALLLRWRVLLAHEDRAVALIDRPAGERAQGRGAQRFAGAQVETGVVPGAAHGVVDHEAVAERTVIVRAVGADREDVAPAAHQQNLLVSDMADELAAVGELGKRDALREIGAGRLGLILGHAHLRARGGNTRPDLRYR